MEAEINQCYTWAMSEINQHNVERVLAGCRWVKHIATYDRVDSTMNIARDLAVTGAPEATVVVAARQDQGRGRLARLWLSPEGSLSISFLIYPPEDKLRLLTMMGGLAVARAVSNSTNIKADLKWPNDVIIAGKKVAGILVESGFVGHQQFAVIGIGINVNLDAAQFAEIADIATSLSRVTGTAVDALALLREIVCEMEELYTNFESGGIYRAWRERLITLNRRVRAITGQETIDGIAADVDEDGTLIIRSDDGRSHTIIAGDVLLRHVS